MGSERLPAKVLHLLCQLKNRARKTTEEVDGVNELEYLKRRIKADSHCAPLTM